jgi:poly(3-hydroxybutyrate) depolymerase
MPSIPRLPPGCHRLTGELPEIGRNLFTLEIPERHAAPVPLIVALHFAFPGPTPEPYTGAVLLERLKPGLAALPGIVLAPDSLGGRWTEPRNEAAVMTLVHEVMATYPIDSRRVLLTGFSRGGEGAWHIGSRHQNVFTGAIPIAAPIAGEKDWSRPVYCIHAENDEIVSYRAAKDHCDALRAAGANAMFHSVPDLTHYQTAAYAPHLAAGICWMKEQWN